MERRKFDEFYLQFLLLLLLFFHIFICMLNDALFLAISATKSGCSLSTFFLQFSWILSGHVDILEFYQSVLKYSNVGALPDGDEKGKAKKKGFSRPLLPFLSILSSCPLPPMVQSLKSVNITQNNGIRSIVDNSDYNGDTSNLRGISYC